MVYNTNNLRMTWQYLISPLKMDICTSIWIVFEQSVYLQMSVFCQMTSLKTSWRKSLVFIRSLILSCEDKVIHENGVKHIMYHCFRTWCNLNYRMSYPEQMILLRWSNRNTGIILTCLNYENWSLVLRISFNTLYDNNTVVKRVSRNIGQYKRVENDIYHNCHIIIIF